MAQSPDHPELSFVQSSGYTAGRAYGPPLWIVVHDMEEEETTRTAENVAQYFATGAGGRSVSSHYTADSDSIVQCVRLADTAWTVGNTPGNYRGINWELAGFGSQSREQWLDDFGRAMFARVAPIMRADAERFGIPLRTLTDAEVADYQPGITSHWQMGRVFGGTDHTDPGPGFPWDYLLDLLTGTNAPEDDMDYIDEKATGTTYACPNGLVDGRRPAIPLTGDRWKGGVHMAGGGQRTKVDKLDLDVFAVLPINASWPPVASGGGGAVDVAAIAEAVNDEAARRLAE